MRQKKGRSAVVELFRGRHEPAEIVRLLKYRRGRVCKRPKPTNYPALNPFVGEMTCPASIEVSVPPRPWSDGIPPWCPESHVFRVVLKAVLKASGSRIDGSSNISSWR